MTHGCLTIRLAGERRSILLHTYHTGMDIPKEVRKVPKRVAESLSYMDYGTLFEWHQRRGSKEGSRRLLRRSPAEKDVELVANCTNLRSNFTYPPVVAGFIARGSFLCPTPPAFVKDLPSWGGQDHPYELVIGRDGLWTLTGYREPDEEPDEDEFKDFDPAAECRRLILQRLKRKWNHARRHGLPARYRRK